MELIKQENVFATESREESPAAHISSQGATFLYITAGVGVMLAIVPYSWYYQGFILGLFAIVLGILFILQGGYQLVKLAVATNAYSLEDLALVIIGPKCQLFTNIAQIVCQAILTIASLYVAASSLSGFFSQISNSLNSTWLSTPLCTLYIYILLTPLFFKKEVDEIKTTGIAQVFSALLLLLLIILYMIQNYSSIRHHNRNHSFNFPLFPNRGALNTLPKFFVVFVSACFAQISLPILKSMGPLTVSKAFRPMTKAAIFLLIYTTLLTMLAIVLFGDVLLTFDTVVKVFYHNSHSFLATLIQLMRVLTTFFHSPVLIFSLRESLLLLFYQCCVSTHEASYNGSTQEESRQLLPSRPSFPMMYQRVTHCAFYSITGSIFVVMVLSTLFLPSLIKYTEILAVPFLVITSMILPNILAIRFYGFKAQKPAVVLVVAVSFALFLETVFVIIDLKLGTK